MDENQGFGRSEEEKQNGEMLKITSNQREASKLCPVCEKEFPCGRALGGHMRVHAAQDSSSHNNGNGDEPPVCTVCRKVFHTWRSLYGHMRCHPERQWRGVLAPGKEEGVRSDSVESGRRVGSVMKWGVTGKRGRKGASAAVESDVWEAAWNLMWMAGGSRSWGRGRYSVSSADFAVKSNMNSRNWFEIDDESELKSNGDSNGDYGLQVSLKQGKMKKRKSKADSGLIGETGDPVIINGSRVDPNAAPGQSVFRCVTCQKEFTSYQALGGHRSKHYKERNPDRGAENGPSGFGGLQWVGPRPVPWTGPVAWTGDGGAGWAMGPQEAARMGRIRLVSQQPSNSVDGAHSVSYPLFC